jgi:hypothetical protein
VDGEAIVLVPPAGESTMYWVNEVSFKAEVSAVRLTQGADGALIASGTEDGTPFEQPWPAGRVCATCGGDLGPSGVIPCEGPLPSDPCQAARRIVARAG